ncbi:hypothetical protein ARNL5_00563 [Anaerolineae bacterium]|nr:hypothetical protein ARNL5_00563 [Anaerolineae bacterium]
MRALLVFCLAGIGLLNACTDSTSPGLFRELAIHTLQDTTLSAFAVWGMPLDSLKLSSKPFFTIDDVTSYRWSTHEFTVSAAVDSQLAALKWVHGHTGGVPFVVVVDGEKIYLGAFWYAYSSLMPQVPYIDVILEPHKIRYSASSQWVDDKRSDPRIYQVLKSAGILIE